MLSMSKAVYEASLSYKTFCIDTQWYYAMEVPKL